MSLERIKIGSNTSVCVERIEREGAVLLLESSGAHVVCEDDAILAGEAKPDTTL